MFFCGLLHPRHPIVREWALVRVVENKAVLRRQRVSGAVPESRRGGVRRKGQVHQGNAAVGYIGRPKALVCQKSGVSEKLPFPPLGAEDADAFPSLFPGVAEALVQKVVCVSVSLHGAGDPQAVNIKIPVRVDGHPGVFRRYVLDEALAPLLAAVKDQPLVKALFHPLFLGKALLAGHGAADVLAVDVFFGDADIVHDSSASRYV